MSLRSSPVLGFSPILGISSASGIFLGFSIFSGLRIQNPDFIFCHCSAQPHTGGPQSVRYMHNFFCHPFPGSQKRNSRRIGIDEIEGDAAQGIRIQCFDRNASLCLRTQINSVHGTFSFRIIFQPVCFRQIQHRFRPPALPADIHTISFLRIFRAGL